MAYTRNIVKRRSSYNWIRERKQLKEHDREPYISFIKQLKKFYKKLVIDIFTNSVLFLQTLILETD